jgi:hypothetical protein
MKKLYTHENRMIIFNLKNVMQGEDIQSVVMNEYSSGGAGDLATFDTWPELWVEDDTQFERAKVILKNIISNAINDDWLCPGCQEKNDAAFKLCWRCGHSA